MGTPGKELLVAADPPQWRTKFITGHAYQELWMGFNDPTTWFVERDWTGPNGSGGSHSWQDQITSGGNQPISGSGDPLNSHNFDALPSGFVPTSNTHGDNSGASPPILTQVTFGSPLAATDPYNRAKTKAFNHNFTEFFWQDALEVIERDFNCPNFSGVDTTDATAVNASSTIPSPWDQSDYQVFTDNGLTSDGAWANAPASPSASSGWLYGGGSSTITSFVEVTYIRGAFMVDRPCYYFFYSEIFWDEPFTQDPNGNLYFRSDGIALPGTIYNFPAPMFGPFTTPIPSPPTPGGYTGTQTGEGIFVVFAISPESYAASLGLTWDGNPFVINGH